MLSSNALKKLSYSSLQKITKIYFSTVNENIGNTNDILLFQ